MPDKWAQFTVEELRGILVRLIGVPLACLMNEQESELRRMIREVEEAKRRQVNHNG